MILKRLNFSGATNATQLQKFIEANIVHRQGFTYGAPDKKHFSIFIDDINAPIFDDKGIQKSNEVDFFYFIGGKNCFHNICCILVCAPIS